MLSREAIVSTICPQETLALLLFKESLNGDTADVVSRWIASGNCVQESVEEFLKAAAQRVDWAGLHRELEFRVSRKQHGLVDRVKQEWNKAACDAARLLPTDISATLPVPFGDTVTKRRRSLEDAKCQLLLSLDHGVWARLLNTGGPFASSSSRGAYLSFVAATLMVAKHALHTMLDTQQRAVISFLQVSRTFFPSYGNRSPGGAGGGSSTGVSSPSSPSDGGGLDPDTRRVWITDSSLCTELALRTLATAAEVPLRSDQKQLRGIMILLRVKTKGAGHLLRRAVGLALSKVPILQHAFAVVPDFGSDTLRETSSKYLGLWFQRLQGGACSEPGCPCTEYKLAKAVMDSASSAGMVEPSTPAPTVQLRCKSCSHSHRQVLEYNDLDNLPVLLVVVGRGRMGDTVRFCRVGCKFWVPSHAAAEVTAEHVCGGFCCPHFPCVVVRSSELRDAVSTLSGLP
jgi:hypothetical protein